MELIRRNTDYALRILSQMAKYKKGKIFYARELSAQEQVPVQFLHKILQRLKNKGLVRSYRGRFSGGFALAKTPAEITLKELLEIMQGKFAVNKCFLGDHDCHRKRICPLHQSLNEAQREIEKSLDKITLLALAKARLKSEKLI